MNATAAAALIAESIAYEEAGRDAADACDKHFWDGWDAELVRQGTPVVLINASAPGLGKVTIFTYALCIALPNGTYSSVRDPFTERVSTAKAARYNGREGYATRRAATLYGADVPVKYKHLV